MSVAIVTDSAAALPDDLAARWGITVVPMWLTIDGRPELEGKRPLAELLHDYGCRPEDVEIAAHSLALANVSVRRGAVLNESTRAALDWLDVHAARLRRAAA